MQYEYHSAITVAMLSPGPLCVRLGTVLFRSVQIVTRVSRARRDTRIGAIGMRVSLFLVTAVCVSWRPMRQCFERSEARRDEEARRGEAACVLSHRHRCRGSSGLAGGGGGGATASRSRL